MNEIKRGQEKYRKQKNLLMIHVIGQPDDVQYWRVIVPDDLDVKSLLVSELHSVPYAVHPGVQRRSVKYVATSGGRAWQETSEST